MIAKFSGKAQAFVGLLTLTVVGYLQIVIKEQLGFVAGIGVHFGFDSFLMVRSKQIAWALLLDR